MDIIESLRTSIEAVKEWVNKRFNAIDLRLAELEYKPIAINSFKNTVYDPAGVKLAGPETTTIVEIGKIITKIDFTWSLNKNPTSQIVNGENVETSYRTITRDIEVSATAPEKTFSYSMSVTDERGAPISKTTSIKFLNGIYYGVLEDAATIDGAYILDAVNRGLLTKKLASNTTTTFTKTALDGQKFAF